MFPIFFKIFAYFNIILILCLAFFLSFYKNKDKESTNDSFSKTYKIK